MKMKFILTMPIWKLRHRKAGRMVKKTRKFPNTYSNQYKFDWMVKRISKLFNLLNVELNVKGYENVPKGIYMLVANHQSNMDAAIISYGLKKQTHDTNVQNKRVVFLAKDDVKEDKRFKNYANLIDTFYIDRNKPKNAFNEMEKFAAYARKEQIGMVIFPEGTRTKDGKLGEFKAGGFKLAKKEFVPILPVTINNSLSSTKIDKRKNKLQMEIIFHKPIKPMSFISQDNKMIAERVKKIIKSKYVEPEIV
ncbi:MAG: 1-acyl-sn-glycerol-3-phosphate acyltransferase [Mycoplasma sp.]|nr:1-acyl-sn-glycerol-3-phosphate acyltransferase [Mycoplasma sp.]